MSVPTDEELREFIEDPLASKLKANRSIRNKKRRRGRLMTVVFLIIALPITCAITVALGMGVDDGFWATYRPAVFLVIGWVFLYRLIWKNYVYEEPPFEYRHDVSTVMVHYIDPRIHHRPEEGFEPEDLRDLLGGHAEFDDLHTEEYFTGNPAGAAVSLGEVDFAATDGDGNTLGACGLAAIWELPEPPTPVTVAVRRGCDGLGPDDDSLQPVNLEDASFPKHIDVVATDSQQAKRRMTSQLVEYIRQFDELLVQHADEPSDWPAEFLIVIRDRRLSLFRPADSYFEQSGSLPSTDTAHLHWIGTELCAVMELVSVTRIGS